MAEFKPYVTGGIVNGEALQPLYRKETIIPLQVAKQMKETGKTLAHIVNGGAYKPYQSKGGE